MKISKNGGFKVVKAGIIPGIYILSSVLVTIAIIEPQGNKAEANQFKTHCMNKLMYSQNRRRSEISESQANAVCQNVSTAEQSAAISNCVKDVMYSSGSKIREQMTANIAIAACQNATDNISGQRISKCMKTTMYNRGRLRDGVTASQAISRCN